eukprot:4447540-Prymnesium_polylepis.3
MVCVGLCWVRDAAALPPAHHVALLHTSLHRLAPNWPHARSLAARRMRAAYTGGLSRLFRRQVLVLQAARRVGRRWHSQRAVMRAATHPTKKGSPARL